MDTGAATRFLAFSPPTAVHWITFIVIGGIAGWIASMIMGTNKQMGILLNIVIGVVGAFIGGLILHLLNVNVAGGRMWFTFFLALGGAVLLLWVVKLVRRV